MKVYTDINQLPQFTKAVITIGTFDGVHLGHSLIIKQLLAEAKAVNGTPVLITFFPHPKQVIDSLKKPLYLLNTPEEKYELLNLKGIKNIVVVPFDKSFAEQAAKNYIENFLVKKFQPYIIIIGYDHRFGMNREGDYQLLEIEALKHQFIVKEIPEHVLQNITISSTKIRAALSQGDIDTASAYLGYNYFFSGRVIEGDKLGRTIGYPTANLKVEDEKKLIPANGVYAVEIEIENLPAASGKYNGKEKNLSGMMNIGVRPTIGGTKKVIEVNIFNFNEDIYGLLLKIIVKKWLRSEEKFGGLGELKSQLAIDKENATTFFLNKSPN